MFCFFYLKYYQKYILNDFLREASLKTRGSLRVDNFFLLISLMCLFKKKIKGCGNTK